jgi:hypothetical protein
MQALGFGDLILSTKNTMETSPNQLSKKMRADKSIPKQLRAGPQQQMEPWQLYTASAFDMTKGNRMPGSTSNANKLAHLQHA